MDVSTPVFILFLLVFVLDVGLIVEALYDLANSHWEAHMKFMWIVVILAIPILGPITSLLFDHMTSTTAH